MKNSIENLQRQQGATLIVGLVLLALLTMVGLAAMDITTVDVKIVSNAKDRQMAFVGAESSLFDGGSVVKDAPDALDSSESTYVGTTYTDVGDTDWWASTSNWSLSAVPDTPLEAQFVIEAPQIARDPYDLSMNNVGPDGKFKGYYPTTAKSVGPGQAEVILQSYFAKRIYNTVVR